MGGTASTASIVTKAGTPDLGSNVIPSQAVSNADSREPSNEASRTARRLSRTGSRRASVAAHSLHSQPAGNRGSKLASRAASNSSSKQDTRSCISAGMEHGGGEVEGDSTQPQEEADVADSYSRYSSYFLYKDQHQHQQQQQQQPRVTVDTGPEGCSCFPTRSSRNVPSMLYDSVDCVHRQTKGYAHLGVFHFNDNWDTDGEATRKPKQGRPYPPITGYVWGYPNFIFAQPDDEQEADTQKAMDDVTQRSEVSQADDEKDYCDQEEDELKGIGENDDNDDENDTASGKPLALGNSSKPLSYTPNTPGPWRPTNSPQLKTSRSLTPRRPPARSSPWLSLLLPQIGYSPAPSEPRSEPTRVGTAASETAGIMHLLPISPRSGLQTSSQNLRKDAGTLEMLLPGKSERRFRGRCYDPSTQESYVFDIKQDFGRRVDDWKTRRDKLRQTTLSEDDADEYDDDIVDDEEEEITDDDDRRGGRVSQINRSMSADLYGRQGRVSWQPRSSSGHDVFEDRELLTPW